MLQAMRSAAKYIWIFIIIAFIGGFLLYESSGLFGRASITPTTAVGSVNGQDILFTDWQRLAQQMEQQATQSSGRSVSLDERQQIETRAFDQLVTEALLRQEIRRRGITVSNDEIANAARYAPPPQLLSDPELQTNGQFDLAKYQRFLASPVAAQSGLLVQLEQYYRDEIPKQKLYQQITAGVFPSDGVLWTEYQDAHDTAVVTYAALRPSPAAIAQAARQVGDADVRAYYDTHRKGLDQPGHAVVTVAMIPRVISAADTAAVRAHAEALRQRILNGEKFEDVAKAESADSGSAANGGDLGRAPLARYVPQFAQAAATLKPGEISGPVLTPFGFHIIRLDARNGDTVALHHILLPIQQSDSAADRTDRKADSLSKLAAGATSPARFDAAVRALGLQTIRVTVQQGVPLTYQGTPIPSVSAWAFSGAKPGETSDLFDDSRGYYIARLESVRKGGIPSLQDAAPEIRDSLGTQRAVAALVDPARKLATAAAASSLEQAGRILNTPIATTPPFTRLSGAPGIGRANPVVGAAFGLPLGAVSAPIVANDAVYVIRVDRRVLADRKQFAADLATLRQQAMTQMQQARVQEFMAGLRATATITDDRAKVLAAMQRTTS